MRRRIGLGEPRTQLLELVARGYSKTAGARELGYVPAYGYQLMSQARSILGVETDTAAVMAALAMGWIDLPAVEEIRGAHREGVVDGR